MKVKILLLCFSLLLISYSSYTFQNYSIKGLKEFQIRVDINHAGIKNIDNITKMNKETLLSLIEKKIEKTNLKITLDKKAPTLVLHIRITKCSFLVWLYLLEDVRTERNPEYSFKGYTWFRGRGTREIAEGEENVAPHIIALIDVFLFEYRNANQDI